jgi:hypothetical protein
LKSSQLCLGLPPSPGTIGQSDILVLRLIENEMCRDRRRLLYAAFWLDSAFVRFLEVSGRMPFWVADQKNSEVEKLVAGLRRQSSLNAATALGRPEGLVTFSRLPGRAKQS